MQGIYKVKLGDDVFEYRNIITNAGRLGLLRAVSGQRQGWAASIVAGIDTTAATINDTELGFQVTGGDISATIIDPINEKLYFKSALPIQDELTIYELGCYSSNTLSTQSTESGGGGILIDFLSSSDWTDVDGTYAPDTTNNRVGHDSIGYAIAASASAKGYLPYVNDLTFLPANAEFKFAYYTDGITDIVLRFKVDDSNYYANDTFAVTDAYHIVSVLKSDFVATGSPTWDQIQTVEIEITAGGSGGDVAIDALRYELPLTGESNLLSRVVLGTPQTKLPGVPLDIEYLLEL